VADKAAILGFASGFGRGAQRYFSTVGRIMENTTNPLWDGRCDRYISHMNVECGTAIACKSVPLTPWVDISLTNNYRQLHRA